MYTDAAYGVAHGLAMRLLPHAFALNEISQSCEPRVRPPRTYYMIDPDQYVQLVNWSGCGNTVNANHPQVGAAVQLPYTCRVYVLSDSSCACFVLACLGRHEGARWRPN